MCGIIGYVGHKNAVDIIMDGLKKLEYRGYDSAGVAYQSGGEIRVIRCKGKIESLVCIVEEHAPVSGAAIGHTRWATHGKPSEENAHPHRSGGIVVVHNGIIENFLELREALVKDGFTFESETDTEVVAHLINKHYKACALEDAIRKAMKEVRGAYALAVMSESEQGKIVALRKDSPLVVGVKDGEYFVASDVPAFLAHSREVVFLNDGEMAVITSKGIKYSTLEGVDIERKPITVSWNPTMAEKGGFRHFMLKEIHEQPRAVADTLTGRFNAALGEVNLLEFGLDEKTLRDLKKVTIAACGTSWHAGLAGKYMIESLARVPVEVDIASEFRYRNPIIEDNGLFVSITQSGETADTLAAQREAKRLGARTLAICNVIGSTASREADSVFYTRSGPEIGVASTKAFTTQLGSLALLAIAIGTAKGTLDKKRAKELLHGLMEIPDKIEAVIGKGHAIESAGREYFKKKDFLYLGRGINFPIALEGALKLKEISYIHAEAYPAGEMKHGPIALIDEEMPVLFIVQKDSLYEKIISNIQEVRSRGGIVLSIHSPNSAEAAGLSNFDFEVPDADPILAPILFTVPLQLLAYHIGVMRGCDVDQPRNLAKSVTVE